MRAPRRFRCIDFRRRFNDVRLDGMVLQNIRSYVMLAMAGETAFGGNLGANGNLMRFMTAFANGLPDRSGKLKSSDGRLPSGSRSPDRSTLLSRARSQC